MKKIKKERREADNSRNRVYTRTEKLEELKENGIIQQFLNEAEKTEDILTDKSPTLIGREVRKYYLKSLSCEIKEVFTVHKAAVDDIRYHMKDIEVTLKVFPPEYFLEAFKKEKVLVYFDKGGFRQEKNIRVVDGHAMYNNMNEHMGGLGIHVLTKMRHGRKYITLTEKIHPSRRPEDSLAKIKSVWRAYRSLIKTKTLPIK